MKFHVLTLFPEMIEQGLGQGIIGRAVQRALISLNVVNIRDYTRDRHGKVDDYPYGGGAGMLMQAQPVYDAYTAVTEGRKVRTIYLTPQGETFTQKKARELSGEEELVFLCGHYEGIDERVLEEIVTDYISIGDYVLTGGELPAMVMIDSIARLLPGVLGNDSSAEEESFDHDLLEYPQYSRPEEWHGVRVPEVLLSGDHRKIASWRREQSIERTAARRPDLYEKYRKKQGIIRRLSREKRNNIHMMESLAWGQGEVFHAAEADSAGEWDILVYDEENRLCMVTAENVISGEKLADRAPAGAEEIVVSQDFMRDIFMEKGYEVSHTCRQMLYTCRQTLPVKYREIRRLSEDAFSYVNCYYPEDAGTEKEVYIRERLQAGVMFGAFDGECLVGFAGLHRTGIPGMLFVEETRRRQGIGKALESYMINRILERGRTPYLYVDEDDTVLYGLQKRLGFYQAEKKFWRLKKSACK